MTAREDIPLRIKRTLAAHGIPLPQGKSPRITPYRPFAALPDRYRVASWPGPPAGSCLVRLGETGGDIVWTLPSSGAKPGHGLFLAEHLDPGPAPDGLVDLGTGPLAFLAILAAARGAGCVWAVDLDPATIATAEEAVARSPYRERIRCRTGDLFAPVEGEQSGAAVIHPPMLPDPEPGGGHAYHVGGNTGRETLDRAIASAGERLAPWGALTIGQFEFLGVERPWGDPACTSAVLRAHGFDCRVLARYEVPMTERLLERWPLIRRVYPDAPFFERNGVVHHAFVVLEAGRLHDGPGRGRPPAGGAGRAGGAH